MLVRDYVQFSDSSAAINYVPSRDSDNATVSALMRRIELLCQENEGWIRANDTALSLLSGAKAVAERAEATIARQQARIAQLECLATTDELTGLDNRRGFGENFHRELDRGVRGHGDGGLLILIDLDNFKAINDTFGHMAGDACLRLVAATLKSEIRAMDTAARLGGDEFVLLLANTNMQKAAGRAQDIADHLNRLSLAWNGEEIPVRASVGLKEYSAGDHFENVFDAADNALYADKEARRNAVLAIAAAVADVAV